MTFINFYFFNIFLYHNLLVTYYFLQFHRIFFIAYFAIYFILLLNILYLIFKFINFNDTFFCILSQFFNLRSFLMIFFLYFFNINLIIRFFFNRFLLIFYFLKCPLIVDFKKLKNLLSFFKFSISTLFQILGIISMLFFDSWNKFLCIFKYFLLIRL